MFILQSHTWTVEATLLVASTYGSLAGSLTTTFDPTSGQAMFPDLQMSGFGIYYIQFRVVSNPADFNMTLNERFVIVNPAHIGMTIEETYEVKVRGNI